MLLITGSKVVSATRVQGKEQKRRLMKGPCGVRKGREEKGNCPIFLAESGHLLCPAAQYLA